ncbi:MAG TPA: hypothetical protein VNH45_03485 [Gaiellaceae bacterium]|nr:hypothetical protein [Gaiellaceae bacterium]
MTTAALAWAIGEHDPDERRFRRLLGDRDRRVIGIRDARRARDTIDLLRAELAEAVRLERERCIRNACRYCDAEFTPVRQDWRPDFAWWHVDRPCRASGIRERHYQETRVEAERAR